MTDAEYRKLPGLTATILKAGIKSMLNARHAMTATKDDTPSLRMGRLIHMAVLEPAAFAKSVTTFHGTRRGKAWDDFCADAEGIEIISPDERATISEVVSAIMENADAAHVVAGIQQHEQILQWTDKRYGYAKCRVDGICANYWLELKTTRNAELDAFERQSAALGYYVQLGWYTLGLAANNLPTECRIITVETSAPYDVVVYRPDDLLIEEGQKKAIEIATRIRECEASGVWPGVAPGLRVLSLPTWMEPEIVLT